MSITAKAFGTCTCGKEITAYTIANSKGMKATVINYGAILTELFVPDKDGKAVDVVLGYDTLEPYFENGSFFGATVGRSANRIADAKFEIDGVTYQLDVNDGPNNLHSQFENGMHKRYRTDGPSGLSVLPSASPRISRSVRICQSCSICPIPFSVII